jgi:phenylpropionate dioxygenase-like ring-hydroxylating dioxygenase large terminal subunit
MDANEKTLATGLRRRWWCIGPSAMFQKEPVGLTRLGEKLVGWRDETGKLHLIEDRCPHRGVALSIGKIMNDDLACAYHGVRVTGDGIVSAVPGVPDCSLVGKKLVKSYPVVEHFQGVFAYFGDEASPEPPPLTLAEDLLSPEWTGLIVSATWNCNYLYVLDNLLDPLHTTYLHEESYSMGIDSETDFVEAVQEGGTINVTRRNDRTSIDQMQFVDDSTIYVRVGVALPPALGPGGMLRVITTVVPIDENRCQVNFWRMRKISGWQADMWRFMFNQKYDAAAWEVLEQDRVALDTMPPWGGPENLYQHDAGLLRMRRYLRSETEKQAAA